MPFSNSKRNIRDERNIVLNDHFAEVNHEEGYPRPFEEITLISDDKNNIIPTEACRDGKLVILKIIPEILIIRFESKYFQFFNIDL